MLYFPIVIGLYFVIPSKWRKMWLLLASYYFYMSWNAKYVLLIGTSTIATYICGLLLSKCMEEKAAVWKKKTIIVSCMILNLGILAVFKYGNFTIDSVNAILKMFHMALLYVQNVLLYLMLYLLVMGKMILKNYTLHHLECIHFLVCYVDKYLQNSLLKTQKYLSMIKIK